MNKKIITITLVLLLIFCIEPVCLADNFILKSSEPGSAIPKISVDKITVDSITAERHKNFIEQADKEIKNYKDILKKNGFKKTDKLSKGRESYYKMDLLDGDYAVWYSYDSYDEYENFNFQEVFGDKYFYYGQKQYVALRYIAEYHKDKSIMGLVKAKKYYSNGETIMNILYEYRTNYNTTSDKNMGLKHILFIDKEEDNSISQYLYNVNGNLLCKQVNNVIYISDEARNMIPDLSKQQFGPNSYILPVKIERFLYKSGKFTRTVIALPFYGVGIATAPIGIGYFIFLFADLVIAGNDFDHH